MTGNTEQTNNNEKASKRTYTQETTTLTKKNSTEKQMETCRVWPPEKREKKISETESFLWRKRNDTSEYFFRISARIENPRNCHHFCSFVGKKIVRFLNYKKMNITCNSIHFVTFWIPIASANLLYFSKRDNLAIFQRNNVSFLGQIQISLLCITWGSFCSQLVICAFVFFFVQPRKGGVRRVL
jgi:hypothetical protein